MSKAHLYRRRLVAPPPLPVMLALVVRAAERSATIRRTSVSHRDLASWKVT